MRLKSKDLLASILFAAIAVPSVGYLINGEMPFIKDPRGMSATGLALGVVTYLVIRRDDLSDRVGTNKTTLAGTSLVLGSLRSSWPRRPPPRCCWRSSWPRS